MLKHVWQIVILTVIIIGLVLFQYSFVSALDNPWQQLNLVLSSLIFILFFLDFRISLIAAFIAGLLLDLTSFNFFGFYLLIFFTSLVLAQWILKNWLTNRSFYALLALVLSVTFFYNILAALILYLVDASYHFLSIWRGSFFINILYQSIWGFLFVVIFFNLMVSLSKKIKPFFLESKSLYDDI